jgi:hypothetical protein
MARNYITPAGFAFLAYASLFPQTGGATNDLYYSTAHAPSCITAVPSVTEYVVEERSGKWVKFQALVNQWRAERGARSSITQTSMLQPYQSIIGMGDSAVPLIISELKLEGDDPDQWFWALRAITGANPVRPEDQGDMLRMARAWIQWAEDQGYAG